MVTQLLLLNKRKTKVIPAPLTATTNSDSQTITLQSVGVSAATVIDWGDGTNEIITGTATHTHMYAVAGMYDITFSNIANLTNISISDSKIAVNTAALRGGVNIGIFILFNVSGSINTSHMIDWRPVIWRCFAISSTADINIDTSHMIDWRPTTWHCTSMPSTADINIDTSHMVDWRPSDWRCTSMPSTATINIDTNSQRNWISTNQLLANNIHLSTVQCDAVIEEFWQQALAGTRTATGGTINISANSPITGTIQAPVGSPANTGEKVYELINDSLGNGFNKWTTITVDTA